MEAVLKLARKVLDRAAGAGGDVEAYVEHRVVTTVQAGSEGEVSHVGRADTYGVGVRCVQGEHVGYASTADLGDHGLDAVVARARANAELGDRDPAGAALPAAGAAEPIEGLRRPQLSQLSVQSRLELVTDLARRATSLDSRVRRLASAEWRDEHRRVAVASTLGVRTSFESAFAELWCDAVGADGSGEASDYGYWWGRDPDLLNVEALATEAVSRTVRLLGPPASVRTADSVVLDPEVAATFMAVVGRLLTGGALGNRRSPFSGRQGEAVAAHCVSLFDDGRCAAAPGGAPVDSEGVPRRRTPLIEAGVLVGALHSSATAASGGSAHSTGNARRSNHKAAPRAAPTALQLTPVAGVAVPGDAAYLQQLSGSRSGISSVTGRVSVGGVGFLLRDGEPSGRLPTVPLATSLKALLTEVIAVGEDARVVSDQPVLAPTVVWRPPTPVTW